MIFRLITEEAGLEEALQELAKGRNISFVKQEEQAQEAISISVSLWEEEKITVSYSGAEKREAMLTACNRTFLCRAFMTLCRELEKQGENQPFLREEKVWLSKNGTMLDCSRNSVLTVETIQSYIRFQAALGMNTMMLYTEDTYEVPEYPYFGAYRGRYSRQELEEIVAYAELFGIEMIPCIQTLAHLKNALRWETMQELRDNDDILMVGEEKVYTFIETCIRRATECFKTKRVHLGMDEAWALGLGKYLLKNGYHKKAEIMSAHLERVNAICRKLGLEPMIWSDMYLCMNAADEGYYSVPLQSDLSGAVKPPQEVTLVYWDYYHKDKEFYEQYLRMHRQLSDKVIFAGGGWVWNGVSPNLTVADQTTEAALQACKKLGVKEAVCTMWQDDGAETPMAAGLLSILRFAEHGFSEEVTEGQIREQFEFLTGASYEAFRLLDKLEHLPGSGDNGNPSKYLLYQDVLLGLFDGHIADWKVEEHYKKLSEHMRRLAVQKAGNSMDDVVTMYLFLAELLSVKGDMGNRLCKAYQEQDREELARIAGEEIPFCMEKLQAYRDARETVWNQESKIFGFEVIDQRLGGLMNRLKTAQKRLTAYVEGALPCIPELEEPRLDFAPTQEAGSAALVNCNDWKKIVSASQI